MKRNSDLAREIEEQIKEKQKTREKILSLARDASEDEIRAIVKNESLPRHHFIHIVEILITCKAILRGHFELRSGGHSSTFLQFARIAGYPKYFERISKMLAHMFWDVPVTVILSPISIGGLYGQSIARELGVQQLILAELNDDKPAILHGTLTIEPGEKVLIINDLTTTGKGILSLHNLVEACGAETVGVGLFACRYADGIEAFKTLLEDKGIPRDNIHPLVEFLTDYAKGKEACPQCAKGEDSLDARLLI